MAALQRAARPVYRMLEADPLTKALIDEIRELKQGQTVADAPSSCAGLTPRELRQAHQVTPNDMER